MARYMIREKLLAFGDDFTIQDEHGRDVLYADGKVLTIRDRLILQDMEGREVANIYRRLLSLGAAYVIERGGQETVVYKHLFTFLRCKFTVDVPGPGDLEATGSFLHHDYEFRNAQGDCLARVSKRWISISDTYGVEIADGVDDVLILAAVIVIDRCCHEER